MWWVPVFALCIAVTALIDLAAALFGLARTRHFWPSAFCACVGGFSGVLMAIIFLDFDASAALYSALAALSAAALLCLVPAVRSMA